VKVVDIKKVPKNEMWNTTSRFFSNIMRILSYFFKKNSSFLTQDGFDTKLRYFFNIRSYSESEAWLDS